MSTRHGLAILRIGIPQFELLLIQIVPKEIHDQHA